MKHFRTIVAGAASWDRFGADQTREAQCAEIEQLIGIGIVSELLVVLAVVTPEVLTVELVDPVHGCGSRKLVFTYLPSCVLGFEIGHAVDSDRARVNELDGHTIPSGLDF